MAGVSNQKRTSAEMPQQPAKKSRLSGPAAEPGKPPSGPEAAKAAQLGMAPGKAPTLIQIQQDRLTEIANSNWARAGGEAAAFKPELVAHIYNTELKVTKGPKPVRLQRVMVLEIGQYLEKYLWPNFEAESASFEHVMSIILLVNEKFRENVPAWDCFHSREDAFHAFFQRTLTLKEQYQELSIHEKISYLLFFINCFQSFQDDMVRSEVLRLVSLELWHALSAARLKREMETHGQLKPFWQKVLKKDERLAKTARAAGTAPVPPRERVAVKFLPALLVEFLQVMDSVVPETAAADAQEAGQDAEGHEGGQGTDVASVLYCNRFLEFLIDLLSQLPTRKFVHALVEDKAIVVKCRMSRLYAHATTGGRLFSQLVDLLRFYEGFEINDHTGAQLTDEEVVALHTAKLSHLQNLLFKEVPKLRELAMAHVAAVEKRSELQKHIRRLSDSDLLDLVTSKLHLVSDEDPWTQRRDFLEEVMLATFERRPSQREAVNALPLYPNEDVMWDENLVPSINYTGEGCLALPKLNLQFLTLHDYLLRNFNLFRLESTYEIREDIANVLKHFSAERDVDGGTVLKGWARMAVPVQGFGVTEVKAPLIGEVQPAAVLADVSFTVQGYRDAAVRAQWDDLKEHDVLFLLTLRAREQPLPADAAARLSVPERFGLQFVRGCEVVEVRDEGGVLMNDFTGQIKPDQWKPPQGSARTLKVALDAAQYQLDIGCTDEVYGSFNLLVRREAKENNFKAILESIRDLMNEDATVPAWLHDIFLGYGNPAAARWTSMPADEQLRTVDFKDTFLDAQHLRDCFPSHQVRFVTPDGEEDGEPRPPFRITLPPPAPAASQAGAKSKKAKAAGAKEKQRNGAHPDGAPASSAPADAPDAAAAVEQRPLILAEAYTPPDPGPYPQDQPKQNSVRFTGVQVEAITAGAQPGLTMVVGPPGTGKTDTAVQIAHVLYHNCPSQRTLLITHSNQALNDIFAKIMQRDVPARYLLRLGLGEKELDTEEKFSRQGRVNAMLNRRLELLTQVERLAGTLKVSSDVAYTCETAAHFWLLEVYSRWEKFVADCEAARDRPAVVKERFPFGEFFADAPGFALGGRSYAGDMRACQGCFRHLQAMFTELEECRAFELLKTTADRSNYLLCKQAKVVAMTCTHAALKRRDFLALALKYDNLLMEESAQILEIETLLPMLLQRPQPEDGRSRLKRCILIGDHQQLPPVVKNQAFQRYSHMDQSLFTRFVRLGVPYTQLDMQGRARPSLATLYNWRYRALGDLPAVREGAPFLAANAGLAHEYQLVDVGDYNGRGELEPSPHFFQNLGEAEYLVSLYQYMRLVGYPADKISILTTYNGQKSLLKDVIERRCARHPLFGAPRDVDTVDRFQGQQNDYILLSLVRTRTVGHLRDVRRLVVAMSRSRLGLYVFGRRALFEQCFELQPTMRQLLKWPDRLALVLREESIPTLRKLGEPCMAHLVTGPDEMVSIVQSRIDRLQQLRQAEARRQQIASAGVASMLAAARARGYGATPPPNATAPPAGPAVAGFVPGGRLQPDGAVTTAGGDVPHPAAAAQNANTV